MYSEARIHGLAKSIEKTAPHLLARGIPIYGPRFHPPTYLDAHRKSATPDHKPETAYLKPVTTIYPFYFPQISSCPHCGSSEITWEGFTPTGHCEMHGIRTEETALGCQLSCKKCEARRAEERLEIEKKSGEDRGGGSGRTTEGGAFEEDVAEEEEESGSEEETSGDEKSKKEGKGSKGKGKASKAKAKKAKKKWSKKTGPLSCFATTNSIFWETWDHWKIPCSSIEFLFQWRLSTHLSTY